MDREKIVDSIKNHKVCKQLPKYTNNLQSINMDIAKDILNNKFTSAPDMKAVMCMFNTIMGTYASKSVDKYGLYNLTKHMKELYKLDSVIYNDTFIYIFCDKIYVYLKKAIYEISKMEVLREYFLGTKAINNLRYSTPVFTYTLGGFSMGIGNNQLPYVVYEKVPGNKLYKETDTTFDEWLIIYIQLLLGLEVAQRQIGFTHYLLDQHNVIIRNVDNLSYDIPIDNLCFKVENIHKLPVIINYNKSCAYIDGDYIGKVPEKFTYYYSFNYMIPGSDMYMFMLSIPEAWKQEVTDKIYEIFQIYNSDDPYNVYEKSIKKQHIYDKVSHTKLPSSKAATYTPLMMVKWLINKYPNIISKHVTVTDRKMYLPLQFSNTLNEYDKIFNKPVRDIAKLLESCIGHIGYVMFKYNLNILVKYNKNLHSETLEKYIVRTGRMLLDKSHVNRMVNTDLQMLKKVFDIGIPNQYVLNSVIEKVLNLAITFPIGDKRRVMRETGILKYHSKLQPYLDFYYMMLETESENKYSDWVSSFLSSVQYQFYIKNLDQVTRTIRWLHTLTGSMYDNTRMDTKFQAFLMGKHDLYGKEALIKYLPDDVIGLIYDEYVGI